MQRLLLLREDLIYAIHASSAITFVPFVLYDRIHAELAVEMGYSSQLFQHPSPQ